MTKQTEPTEARWHLQYRKKQEPRREFVDAFLHSGCESIRSIPLSQAKTLSAAVSILLPPKNGIEKDGTG